jgi:hypothetical protein
MWAIPFRAFSPRKPRLPTAQRSFAEYSSYDGLALAEPQRSKMSRAIIPAVLVSGHAQSRCCVIRKKDSQISLDLRRNRLASQ